MTAASFSVEQLDTFAAAVCAVRKIIDASTNRVSRAKTDTERQIFEREGANKVVAAVEHEGLRVDVYNAIIDAARHDTALRARINVLVSAMTDPTG